MELETFIIYPVLSGAKAITGFCGPAITIPARFFLHALAHLFTGERLWRGPGVLMKTFFAMLKT
jgi:hypothetical protein